MGTKDSKGRRKEEGQVVVSELGMQVVLVSVRCFGGPTGHTDCLGQCWDLHCGDSRARACTCEVSHREDAALLQGTWHPHASAQPLHALPHLPQQRPFPRGNAWGLRPDVVFLPLKTFFSLCDSCCETQKVAAGVHLSFLCILNVLLHY